MDLVSPLNVTVAFTGPSETSSCHPSLFAQCVMGLLLGEPEFPNPPRTSRRACLSVRISPRGTTTPRNLPLPKSAVLLGPVKERGPGSITKLLRSATEAFLRGVFEFKPPNCFHAAFLFARYTVQEMVASFAVISLTSCPFLS